MTEEQKAWEMRMDSAARGLKNKGTGPEKVYAATYQEGVRNGWRPKLKRKYR